MGCVFFGFFEKLSINELGQKMMTNCLTFQHIHTHTEKKLKAREREGDRALFSFCSFATITMSEYSLNIIFVGSYVVFVFFSSREHIIARATLM